MPLQVSAHPEGKNSASCLAKRRDVDHSKDTALHVSEFSGRLKIDVEDEKSTILLLLHARSTHRCPLRVRLGPLLHHSLPDQQLLSYHLHVIHKAPRTAHTTPLELPTCNRRAAHSLQTSSLIL